MGMMDEETANKVRDSLGTMKDPVHILVYVKEDDCKYCSDTLAIV